MQELQERISYHFNDLALLELALTHPSYSRKKNNQRLEFLGDAVLALVVADLLYKIFSDEQEGELARRQAQLVCGKTLFDVAREINLGESLKLAASEVQSGGRDNASNLEDALEALIGAIYLDGGLEAAENFIKPRWQKIAKNAAAAPKDAKTALQEWAQGRGLPLPLYVVIETEGSAHAPLFTMEVRVEGYKPARAKASSKKMAQQEAAATLLERLQSE